MYNKSEICNDWPVRNKAIAGVLAILFGGFGAHKFYLGKTYIGIIYLIFSWTCIPIIIAFCEGLFYLKIDDYTFQIKNKVKLH